MNLRKLTPNLMVADVNRTIAYYQQFLGFELSQTVPDTGQLEWASMVCGEVKIMFQAESNLAEDLPELAGMQTGGTLTFFIQMAGIDELYNRIKDSVVIVQSLHTMFYGTPEFMILDCNGYLITFAESA